MKLSFRDYVKNEHWADALWAMHGGADARKKFSKGAQTFGSGLGHFLSAVPHAAGEWLWRKGNEIHGIKQAEEAPDETPDETPPQQQQSQPQTDWEFTRQFPQQLQGMAQKINVVPSDELQAIIDLGKKAEAELAARNKPRVRSSNMFMGMPTYEQFLRNKELSPLFF